MSAANSHLPAAWSRARAKASPKFLQLAQLRSLRRSSEQVAAVCYRWENRELRRQCPGCGKVVKLQDTLCTRCGTDLDFPDVAIASEQAVGLRRSK